VGVRKVYCCSINHYEAAYSNVYTCFVDNEKAYDRVPREKLWGMLREYGVDGHLLMAVKSLYSCSEVCVHVGGVKLQPFTAGVGLRQGWFLSPPHPSLVLLASSEQVPMGDHQLSVWVFALSALLCHQPLWRHHHDVDKQQAACL